MCIAVLSTAHPDYSLILISNRDEFLSRSTLPADWWDEGNAHVLGGRDLQRSARGTWLGITRQGRIAVLTNFRDEGKQIVSDRSRGEIPNAFLLADPNSKESIEDFAKRLVEVDGVGGVGGFSLIFGQLKAQRNGKSSPLGIISNRTPDVRGVIWIAQDAGKTSGHTCALSNSRFGEHLWPKVVAGETLLSEGISASSKNKETQDQLLCRCFEILSTDTLPRGAAGESWETVTKGLKNSIFIPPIGGSDVQDVSVESSVQAADSEAAEHHKSRYGTQKQTVVLVDQEGNVTFVEKSLYGDGGLSVPKAAQIRQFKFQIENWRS